MRFSESYDYLSGRVDAVLKIFVKEAEEASLCEAMHYSVFSGGKRLRPMLVYATCQALGGTYKAADIPAAAIECLHVYSLIHDDLPAIDNDDLRRGKPTCHRAFSESTAILSGDALHSLAFEIISSPSIYIEPSRQIEMIQTLGIAGGAKGLIAGQIIDMLATGTHLDLCTLERMHRLKTGALIRASVQMGALASGPLSQEHINSLNRYADAIGLAFQIQDDILDLEGDTEVLGKKKGADILQGKVTYPSLIGLDESKRKVLTLHEEAVSALLIFDDKSLLLRQLADFVVKRNA